MKNQPVIKKLYSNEEKLRAAYALNLCAVSVSQIVDYKDSYILEQEYDSILNNLNLKQMPKDEALLKIISELLNTITFFRIQEIKRNQIEKKYRQRLKNAIWAAIPNLNTVVSGAPVAIALSIATEVGSGYMNYRREKENALIDKEDTEIELQITAIEQLNALKRELFTTAWRLADEYDFEDEWRLTEKQITQYNIILQDSDIYRKYARLEAISDRFLAYPPFWYIFGHTANYIAEISRNEMNALDEQKDSVEYDKAKVLVQTYTEKTKAHYEHYFLLCNNNLLREDQLTAIFALEYVDILWREKEKDFEKILSLLKLAEKMAPNYLDILQLCSISYLKIGATNDAIRLFKILINEDYNATANAKLLSKLYVSKYISTNDAQSYADYKILEQQIDNLYLYPMPKNSSDDIISVDSKFIKIQKAILKKAYRNTLDAYAKKRIIDFNSIFPAPNKMIGDIETYYSYSASAKKYRTNDVRKVLSINKTREEYITAFKNCEFRQNYIDILNKTVSGIEILSCFKNLDSHDRLIKIIEAKIRNSKAQLAEIQVRLDKGNFEFNDYLILVNNFSYQYFTENFFDVVKKKISESIDEASDMRELNIYDSELAEFCDMFKLPSPEEYLYTYKEITVSTKSLAKQTFFNSELIGLENDSLEYTADDIKSMLSIVEQYKNKIILNSTNTSIYLLGDSGFDVYFKNNNLKASSGSLYLLKQKVFAVIDDKSKNDFDLAFCVDGVVPIVKNKIRDTVSYGVITYSTSADKSKLILGYPDIYVNNDVDLGLVKFIVDKIEEHWHN